MAVQTTGPPPRDPARGTRPGEEEDPSISSSSMKNAMNQNNAGDSPWRNKSSSLSSSEERPLSSEKAPTSDPSRREAIKPTRNTNPSHPSEWHDDDQPADPPAGSFQGLLHQLFFLFIVFFFLSLYAVTGVVLFLLGSSWAMRIGDQSGGMSRTASVSAWEIFAYFWLTLIALDYLVPLPKRPLIWAGYMKKMNCCPGMRLYFPAKIVFETFERTGKLPVFDPSKNYLLSGHPHGLWFLPYVLLMEHLYYHFRRRADWMQGKGVGRAPVCRVEVLLWRTRIGKIKNDFVATIEKGGAF